MTDDDSASRRSTLQAVQHMVDMQDRQDRAMLRPWILAHYDDWGNPQIGYQAPKG